MNRTIYTIKCCKTYFKRKIRISHSISRPARLYMRLFIILLPFNGGSERIYTQQEKKSVRSTWCDLQHPPTGLVPWATFLCSSKMQQAPRFHSSDVAKHVFFPNKKIGLKAWSIVASLHSSNVLIIITSEQKLV